jgi:hypothetical protein
MLVTQVEMQYSRQFSKILKGYNKFNENPFVGSRTVTSGDTHAELANAPKKEKDFK